MFLSLSALRNPPWQRACVERFGAIHRECFDHVIVFSENALSQHERHFELSTFGR